MGPLVSVPLIGAVLLIIGFVAVERRVASPMLDLSLFRWPDFDGATLAALVDFEVLLRESDLVSLHVTLDAKTRGMIGEAQLRAMKPGSFIVNTARGGLIDEEALSRALKDGHLAGAALDTFDPEPLPADSPLSEPNNIILTPHMVGHTRDVMASVAPALPENIRRVMGGRLPVYTKNAQIAPAWRQRLRVLGSQYATQQEGTP